MGRKIGSQKQSDRRTEIRDLKESGLSYKGISSIMGISRQRIQQLVSPTDAERLLIIKSRNGICDKCKSKSNRLSIHHKTYSPAIIEVLCPICHCSADQKNGTRRTHKPKQKEYKILHKNNTSGYRGVVFFKPTKNWRVSIRANGKRHTVGYFDDPIEAARAYDNAARKYHGEFARTNF